jgi:hypothetical protein
MPIRGFLASGGLETAVTTFDGICDSAVSAGDRRRSETARSPPRRPRKSFLQGRLRCLWLAEHAKQLTDAPTPIPQLSASRVPPRVPLPIQSRPVGQGCCLPRRFGHRAGDWDNFSSLFRESVPSHESRFSFRSKTSRNINLDWWPIFVPESVQQVPPEQPARRTVDFRSHASYLSRLDREGPEDRDYFGPLSRESVPSPAPPLRMPEFVEQEATELTETFRILPTAVASVPSCKKVFSPCSPTVLPVPFGGGSTTLVGQLPIETKCPDPPANLFPPHVPGLPHRPVRWTSDFGELSRVASSLRV